MTRTHFDPVIAFRQDLTVSATLEVVEDFSLPVDENYVVIVWLRGATYRGAGHDVFWALAAVRDQLENRGWRLAIQGASVRCFPSRMMSQTGATTVYRHSTTRDTYPTVVGTFEAAEISEIVSVTEQIAAEKLRAGNMFTPLNSTPSP